MRTITDHLGREITFPYPPKRIVSLVPAITETMYHLQLAKEIVGRPFLYISKGQDSKRS
ncbi:hypothetical protein [Paracerasibacillus soli]|uniref:Uncharacterized protein n=1 Tax=Paracerasibacillus soli TaxID=480284 RepID=A0ABU5CMX7_9BACI|nr:hypothetical protein [Virgibacillus soli]MDY0407719.1 hypothetical protein [Virgibacillus soli]